MKAKKRNILLVVLFLSLMVLLVMCKKEEEEKPVIIDCYHWTYKGKEYYSNSCEEIGLVSFTNHTYDGKCFEIECQGYLHEGCIKSVTVCD